MCGISYSANSGNKTGSLACSSPFPSTIAISKHVGWVVQIDTAGNIIQQDELCFAFSGSGVGAGPAFVDSITDFVRLSNGQYILAGNFVNYGGYNNTNHQYYVNLISGYVRFDSTFQQVSSAVFFHAVYYPNGADVVNSFQIASSAGNICEMGNGSIMACWTYKGTYASAGCGDNSNTYFTYANTLQLSAKDVPGGFYTYGSQTGNCIAKHLQYFNNNLYLFTEHIPLPKTKVAYPPTCLSSLYYQRTAPARADSGNRDCWVIQISQGNMPITDWAYGAGADWRYGAVVYTGDSLLLIGGTVNAGPLFDKTTPNKGGRDYWLLGINPTTMKVKYDYDLGGGSDDWLSAFSYYGDAIFLSGTSFSDKGLDKTTVNQSGTTLTTDQWTAVLAQAPARPVLSSTLNGQLLMGCPNSSFSLSVAQPLPGIQYLWTSSNNAFAPQYGSTCNGWFNGPMSTYSIFCKAFNGYAYSGADTVSVQAAKVPGVGSFLATPPYCGRDSLKVSLAPDTVHLPSNCKAFVCWKDSSNQIVILRNCSSTYSLPPSAEAHQLTASRADSVFYPISMKLAAVCYSAPVTQVETPLIPPLPFVDVPQVYCNYQNPVLLTVSNDSTDTFTWNTTTKNLGTGRSIRYERVDQEDTIWVTAHDAKNCPSFDHALVLRTTHLDFQLTVSNAAPEAGQPVQFLLSPDSVIACSYDFGDGTTSTEVHPWHYYNQRGTYMVKVYVDDTVGCKDTVAYNNLTVVANANGIPSIGSLAGVEVYPNPLHGQLTIKTDSDLLFPLHCLVSDVYGQKVVEQTIFHATVIDLTTLENGYYNLLLRGEAGQAVFKLIQVR